ncbi:methylated-DNA--[protein]-cysteine S-methyltransferase [Streptosporangium carneum]|uniref:Methylated-DNA--[protein]-cysteine S-methyltransferase n=1 Tax=Streptosporangium carneum TaxID=47481 RepID=A0A9W6MDH8_9ACTN|nr:methylated-DNA--[protein]-cysteine S-methyltransferase [Streptosporangium carneum]GLK09808.1 hypothetical protein GCM10017600_32140 [Streptosporangium carneum]
MDSTHDPLLARLAGLATDAPDGLLGRIAARWTRAPSPVGELLVAFTDEGIVYARLEGEDFAASFRERFARPLLPAPRPPAGLLPALRSGRSSGLRFDLRDADDFQRDVLRAALTVPRGQVRPYSWIARLVGRPEAAREVASTLERNPVPVLIPCHRVVRADGAAGGHAFGRAAKEALLRAENVDLGEVRSLAEAGVLYLGSDTTGIVCFPTCHNARRITSAHRHGFHSVAQAERAGYRTCLHCRPGLAEAG